MRILVAGATGYIGSRLVPELLRRGHDVVAVSSSEPEPERFSWGDEVETARMDATDPHLVQPLVESVDAVCYLVHGLSSPRFRDRDRLAAETVRDAVTAAGVRRLVYLSGLVPDVPEDELSPHIASRLEVERVLQQSSAATLTLRAGIVIGAGSTSFEILRQTVEGFLVQPVPGWMHSRIQPIGVADAIRALADGLESTAEGVADIGGPDVVTYPELLGLYAELAGLTRVRLPALVAPVPAVAMAAGLLSAAPFWTTAALIQSLQHDMVCRPGQPDPDLVDLTDALPLRDALEQAMLKDGPGGRVSGREASDPAWVRPSLLEKAITTTRLPGSTLVSSAVHVADARLRGLLGRHT